MSLIMNVGGTWYAATPGAILNVPGGVANSPIIIQVNDPTLSACSGSYQMSVCVTNNAVSQWTHTAEFAVTADGWVLDPFGPYTDPYIGSWVAGAGWEGSVNNPDPVAGTSTVLRIKRVVSGTFTITSTTLTFHTDQTQGDSGRDIAFNATTLTIPDGSGDQTYVDSTHHVNPTLIEVGMGTAHTAGGVTGAITLSRIQFAGEGANPFV
jgi:hypothetical protein